MRIIYNEDKGQDQFNRTCPYCKKSVELFRSGNDNAVLFDNKVYHTKCFLKSKSVEKKCKNCKKTMRFSSVDVLDAKVYYYMGSYYCQDCFENLCSNGIQKKSKKWKAAYDNKDLYLEDAHNQLFDLLKKRKSDKHSIVVGGFDLNEYVENVFAEHDINEFLKENYNVSTQSGFYHRYLQPLYQGTSNKYEGVKIPAIHLLEMWKTKLPSFRKQYQNRIQKGKSFTNVQLAAYDLAILISKYDSFLSWKQKQKALEQDQYKENETQSQKINYQVLNLANKKKNNDTEINDILGDIFD